MSSLIFAVFTVEIMVRNRGLRCALDRVIGRALRRGDNLDSDDVSQRQMPTISAHRQGKLSLLLRMLLTWMMQFKSYSNMLKKLLMMPRVFQADLVTHQY
ncbi:hypothetical protein D0Y65_052874 [Glycine soja]|uniref:Uncharacterized protein n=1 Tax=Glycine soja TaxID=3848 RepID=A0A445EZU0_GLYSO|nr:hypothetical protein D0Y65_052874 [Glycine soja]